MNLVDEYTNAALILHCENNAPKECDYEWGLGTAYAIFRGCRKLLTDKLHGGRSVAFLASIVLLFELSLVEGQSYYGKGRRRKTAKNPLEKLLLFVLFLSPGIIAGLWAFEGSLE